MSLAPQELENSASKYAAEAIRLDSQGSRGMAINSYQRAIEALVKLVQIYPDYKLNKVYMERANAYQNRIKALQMSHGLEEEKLAPTQIDNVKLDPPNGHGSKSSAASSYSSSSSAAASAKSRGNVETLKADFDDLVMKEKPKVGWKEVIGLEDAKRQFVNLLFTRQREQTCSRLAGRGAYYFTAPLAVARRCLQLQPLQRLTSTSSMSTLHQ